MMKKLQTVIIAALALCLGAFATSAAAAGLPTGTRIAQAPSPAHISQVAGTGGSIINPLPGEQIADPLPMIAVQLPSIASGPAVIYIVLDGDDVTGDAAISSEYIFFTPSIPLRLGIHNVAVGVFTDESRTTRLRNIYQWQFTVTKTAGAAPIPARGAKPSTTGRYSLNYTFIDLHDADRINHGWYDMSEIKYRGSQWNPQAPIINPMFDIVSNQNGKAFNLHYDRSVREFTGRSYERGYLSMNKPGQSWIVGDVTLSDQDFSELSIANLSMRGIKTVQAMNDGYSLSTFYGRTLDPPDTLLKRISEGFSIMHEPWKGHKARFTIVSSKERGNNPFGTGLNRDTIYSLKDDYRLGKHIGFVGEMAIGNHRGPDNPVTSGNGAQDSAFRAVLSYTAKNFSMSAGHRSFGPKFNPTSAQSTFSERDRKGTYGTISKAGKWWNLYSSYDDYNNNLHHQLTGDITTEYTNFRGMLGLNVKRLPRISWSWSKNYSLTDGRYGRRNTGRTEATNNNVNASYDIRDLGPLNGNRITAGFLEGAVDNESFRDIFLNKYNTWSHTGSRNYTFNTRFKDMFSLSLKTSVSKVRNVFFNPPYTTLSMPKYTTKTWRDGGALQWFVIPFKFITTVSYTREVADNWLEYPLIPTRAIELKRSILDNTIDIQFLYYLSQKRRLTLDLSNFSREFRDVASIGKSYDENMGSLMYSVDF